MRRGTTDGALRTAPGALRVVSALWLIGLALGGVRLAEADDGAGSAPLHDEDVVQAWVAGTPVAEIVERIETSPTAFDVTDEMLAELRLAGLPDALIAAMKSRQAAVDAAARPPADEAQADPTPHRPVVRIALRSPPGPGDDRAADDEAAGALRLVNVLDETTGAALGVRPENRLLDDVAVFVACRTADHVPDQWRSASPLGRDFSSMPRHRMAVFLSGARAEAAPAPGLRRRLAQSLALDGDAARALGVLRLDLPAAIDVEVDPDVAHDLVIGLAVHTADRWLAISLAEWDGVTVADGEIRALAAAISRTGAPVAGATKVVVVQDE